MFVSFLLSVVDGIGSKNEKADGADAITHPRFFGKQPFSARKNQKIKNFLIF